MNFFFCRARFNTQNASRRGILRADITQNTRKPHSRIKNIIRIPVHNRKWPDDKEKVKADLKYNYKLVLLKKLFVIFIIFPINFGYNCIC